MKTTNCKNCNEPIGGKFCSNCGQPAELRRIDNYYLIHEIRDFFFANKGMLYTVKKVLVSPGKSVRSFLAEDRHRFIKPITFLFITSLIYTIVNYLFNIGTEDYQFEGIEAGTTAYRIFDWMLIQHPAYAGIITGLFIALWVKLFFRKAGYNLLEIFILLCFVAGVSTLFMSIASIVKGITGWNILQPASFIGNIYLIWAVGQFFNRKEFSTKKKVWTYVKVFLSYLLVIILMALLIVFIGAVIDEIIKYQ